MNLTAIVLAGGNSSRLGRNKANEPILGISLIEHVVDRLRPMADELLIVTSQEQTDLPELGKTRVLTDAYPGKGPLAGLYTGLSAARYPRSVVVGCDMPFLNTELLRYMVGLSDDFDAVVPRLGQSKVEPLHAIYAKSCLEIIKTHLEHNHLETHAMFDKLRVRYVEETDCRRFDSQLLSFLNINNQADLDRAVSLASTANKLVSDY